MRYENEKSEEITIKRGDRQGCFLSPCLFNIYTEHLILQTLEDGKGMNSNGHITTNIRYAADNTIILTESEQQIQHMIDEVYATCDRYGMEISTKKTKNNDRR